MMNENHHSISTKHIPINKDLHCQVNYIETIPESRNESGTRINNSFSSNQKKSSTFSPLPFPQTEQTPRSIPEQVKPKPTLPDDSSPPFESDRRGTDTKRGSKGTTAQMNYYASDYDYYEMRLTQRNNISGFEENREEMVPSTQRHENANEGSDSNSSFTYDLQAVITNAKPGSTIQLPDHNIKVHLLSIKKPVTIIGSSRSSLDVSHSIQIDLSSYGKTTKPVVFSECIINFEYISKKSFLNQSLSTKRSKESEEYKLSEKVSYSDNSHNFLTGQLSTERAGSADRFYPLFIINSKSICDIRDCQIISKNTEGPTQIFQDICFYVNQNRNSTSDDLAELSVQSTVVNNFYSAIQNSFSGSITLEKLYISKSHSHGINISNPYILNIKECVVEAPTKSCINLRFSKELNTVKQRVVNIDNNELFRGSYGISIFGETMTAHNCNLNIVNNKIYLNQKDGLGIKNINISKINISNNIILENGGNGIFLNHVLDTVFFHQVKLNGNKIRECRVYGITLLDVAVFSENDEILWNHKGGVFISGFDKQSSDEEMQFFRSYPLRNIFTNAKINANKESGVILIGFVRGPVIFNNCELYENVSGLYIKQDFSQGQTDPRPINTKAGKNEDKGFGDIVLEKCTLFQNRMAGIQIKGLLDKVYLKETKIRNNMNYAVMLSREDEKQNLIFKDSDKFKVKDNIEGLIGGTWGAITESNSSSCKGSKCSIF